MIGAFNRLKDKIFFTDNKESLWDRINEKKQNNQAHEILDILTDHELYKNKPKKILMTLINQGVWNENKEHFFDILYHPHEYTNLHWNVDHFKKKLIHNWGKVNQAYYQSLEGEPNEQRMKHTEQLREELLNAMKEVSI